jgi:NAD(P)H-hydrate epimerase
MLNRQQVREVDRRAIAEYGMSGLVLMENAGRGVADKLCQCGVDGPVVICCGKGNNGGDGFVIARHFDLRRLSVKVLLFAEPAELTGTRPQIMAFSKSAACRSKSLRKAPTSRGSIKYSP